MHNWELLFDYLFPPTPEELLVRHATITDIIKEYCPSKKANVYFLSNYQRKLIKAAITTAKFSHNKKAVRLLATLLTTWLTDHPQDQTLLIPIPLHLKRERERGYNQVTRVLNEVSLPNVTINKTILHRHRYTLPQTTLPKNDRTKNILGSFTVNPKSLAPALTSRVTRVIICDDVYTTGSTLEEARRTLAPHLTKNCELVCLAWAH
jgi:ComF family protein